MLLDILILMGAVHVRTSSDVITHTNFERLSGRPFRFCVDQQQFQPVLGNVHLSDDDFITVVSWLKNHMYLDEERYS